MLRVVLTENAEHPCPAGWARRQHDSIACYRLIQAKKTWTDSQKTCQGYGAKLVSIGDRYVYTSPLTLSANYVSGVIEGTGTSNKIKPYFTMFRDIRCKIGIYLITSSSSIFRVFRPPRCYVIIYISYLPAWMSV